MNKTFVKSNITLEEVRPHISNINAYFGVPFDDGGFMMTKQEIKKAKKEFEEAFINTVSLILGITKEEAKTKIKTKKEKGYWCWKHNVEYDVDIKTSKKSIRFLARMHDIERVTLDVSEGRIGYFELAQNGDIYQSTKTINEINSIEDILKKINKEKSDRLTKELKKLKDYEKKAAKELEKIGKQENKLW